MKNFTSKRFYIYLRGIFNYVMSHFVQYMYYVLTYGWLQKKRELSEKVLSYFI
jgi:hypothetical protein